MRFPAVLLGQKVRITGTKGANYWDKRCELLGQKVRAGLWITYSLYIMVYWGERCDIGR